jgi:pyruvate/2-oxoglutarate dehydrogenase complex dihydrolipoamide acyltransferase (E2) component
VGRIATWLKAVGDGVQRGEVIAEVETEKTTLEMESTEAGTIVEIIHAARADVPVGSPIAWVDTDDP